MEINDERSLRAWLTDKPAEWAQTIALRAALRSLPYIGVSRDPWLKDFALLPFGAVITSWVQLTESSIDIFIGSRANARFGGETFNFAGYKESQVAALAADVSYHSADAQSQSMHVLSDCVEAITKADETFRAVEESHRGSSENYVLWTERFWFSIQIDCLQLSKDSSVNEAENLAVDPLGPENKSQWHHDVRQLSERLRAIDPNYDVWIDWYERRIRGERAAFDIPGDKRRVEDKKILRRLAEATDEDFWGKGHEYVNATLKGWIEEARARVARPLPTEESKKSSFFISYATVEEALAREVAAILEERGYTSIAQFKDFQQGNFVRQIREGIAAADRFVALQSKAYWESDHCQSEWDAAYARDPGAKRRRIVPFLLEPAPLPPIASETVYKSLVGLTKAQRKKAIIEWIEYQPTQRSPARLRETLAKQASPDVRVRDEKIDAGPNTVFDKPLVDMDLAELPANLRALLGVLIGSLPSNTPLVVRNCLNAYQNHLVERGTQPFVGTIEPFAAAVRVQIATDAGYWDAGLESLFADFFKRHELLITHFPLNPERELLVTETPIDEFKASGEALLAPVRAVAEAISELKSADLTTEDFDRVEQAHQEFSRDIASLPMPTTNDNVTPKRRYVLGTIGFYERLLAALGAAAGISATPQGQAAIAAVSNAIATLMGFVL